MPLINVMVVDDHGLVREGFVQLLKQAEGVRVVAEAESGEDAIRLGRDLKPHVTLMDLKMPGIGGLEATKKLLRIDSDLRVLVVSVCNDNLFPVKLLQAGAHGYLTKNASPADLLRAIRAVYMGQRFISPDIASQLALSHIADNGDSPFAKLSDRELEVVLLITRGAKVSDIAERLSISPKTVNSYRYRIFEKISTENDVELTHQAIRYGLLSEFQVNDTASSGVMADPTSHVLGL